MNIIEYHLKFQQRQPKNTSQSAFPGELGAPDTGGGASPGGAEGDPDHDCGEVTAIWERSGLGLPQQLDGKGKSPPKKDDNCRGSPESLPGKHHINVSIYITYTYHRQLFLSNLIYLDMMFEVPNMGEFTVHL